MRLLNQKEIKKANQEQTDRGRKVDRYISEKTKELNEFRAKVEKDKKKILDDFVEFAERIAGEKATLEGRFATIEARKGVAFKSLSDLSLRAEKRFEEAQKKEDAFDVRERNLEAREAKVKEDTGKIVKREEMLNAKAEELSEKKEKLDKRDEDLQAESNRIAANLMERTNKVKDLEKQVDDRLIELNLGIESNNATAKLLELQKEKFEKYKEDQERLLQDKRDTLNRGFDELSTLRAKHGQ